MRAFVLLLASYSLVVEGPTACFAKQSALATREESGPSDDAKGPLAVADAGTANENPVRAAGTVGRPTDGFQHPDLDRAWAQYNAAIAKATNRIRDAIGKQFEAATAKGDLDAAQKWEKLAASFEDGGDLSAEAEATPALGVVIAEYEKAKNQLAGAYKSLEKSLTVQKKLLEAKAVRDESQRQFGEKIADADLVKLVREFEQVGIPGWSWLKDEIKDPVAGVPLYRLDKEKKEFTHFYLDEKGNRVRHEGYSPRYKVVGFADGDPNLILVEMTYPREPGQPVAFRFNRKTKEIHSPYGYYGKPVGGR